MLPDSERVTAADAAMERTAKMAAAGQDRAALANCRHAVTLYRELAATQPEAFVPDLATALGTMSDQLAATGATQEAVWTAAEAVDLFRGLVSGADPEAELFTPYLGAALGTWALRLHDAGRDADALTAAQEAASLFANLSDDDREHFADVLERIGELHRELQA